MEQTGRDNKKHIGFFGRCNVGKSTLVNALTGQEISIVSDRSGTTTDSVKKSMELFGYGAVTVIDTAGLDDDTELGQQRVKASMHSLSLVDLAVLVISRNTFSDLERDFIKQCSRYDVPVIAVYNKTDVEPVNPTLQKELQNNDDIIFHELKDHTKASMDSLAGRMAEVLSANETAQKTLLEDIVRKGDVVLLVTPIDSSAPKGRMILPQVQMTREVLDRDCVCCTVKETELEYVLKDKGIKPDLVITDSQVFDFVNRTIPADIPLTSFSFLLARLKGNFEAYLKGTPYLDKLKDGDKVLMLESCTHQPTCEDIGRVKLPNWIRKYTGRDLSFEAVSGLDRIKTPLTEYAMVIQCGGCVATAKQIRSRLLPALENNIPVSNYGLCIAYIHGIFNRAVDMFK